MQYNKINFFQISKQLQKITILRMETLEFYVMG